MFSSGISLIKAAYLKLGFVVRERSSLTLISGGKMFALVTSPCSSLFAVQVDSNGSDKQDSERRELLEAAV